LPPVNDEYLVLKENLPEILHEVDRSRFRAGRRAAGKGAEILVLDDGFQHVELARDLDVVLIDALEPFGFGAVLPAGLLREPLETLRFADAFLITRSQNVSEERRGRLKTYLRWRFPHVPCWELEFAPQDWMRLDGKETLPLPALAGRAAVCFAGIGNPEGFRLDLRSCSVSCVSWTAFADHHHYTRRDLDQLAELARSHGACTWIMTQKDAVKIRNLPIPEEITAYFLRIQARLMNGGKSFKMLLEQASKRPATTTTP
jgi:tetraacyldisaccharide 4'-kinase